MYLLEQDIPAEGVIPKAGRRCREGGVRRSEAKPTTVYSKPMDLGKRRIQLMMAKFLLGRQEQKSTDQNQGQNTP